MRASDYKPLEKALGYRFKSQDRLECALTHPSFHYENPDSGGDNQRLEYLGDAVLSLVCAEHLFQEHPDSGEGDLSQLRSRLTQDRTLARLAQGLEIGSYLRMGRGEEKSGGAQRASNLADALEALIGAAWMDGGRKAANRIFTKVFLPHLNALRKGPIPNNPKGALQELAQQRGGDIPTYEIIESNGPEHNLSFTAQVTLFGETWSGTASSKREAEQLAAQHALEALEPSP